MEIYNICLPKKEIRVSKSQKVNDTIIYYGDDNRYPSRMNNLIERSQTAVACINSLAKFIATEFEDTKNGDVIVGRTSTGKKVTLNNIVKQMSREIAKYNGCYLLVNKDLTGKVVSVQVLDFARVRFSAFDDSGRSNYAYVGDWSCEIKKDTFKKGKFFKYPLFTNNFEVFKAMAESAGTTAEVYHLFLDEQFIYPASTFEQCTYDMATEYEIQLNRYSEITEGTPAKLIIRTDLSDDEREKQAQIDEITQFAGSKGSRVLIIRTPFDEAGNPVTNSYQLDTINDTRDLSKFTEAEKACSNNIRKAINIPAILIDYESATGINISAEQLKSSVDYFDALVEDTRKIVSDALAEIFFNTSIEFNSKNFNLTKKTIRNDE